MDRKLKRWELALLFGVLCILAAGSWLGEEQQELADSVIRFHVIANSDSREDQALKLAVRDRVLEQAQAVYPQNATLPQARAALEGALDQLAQAGQAVVEEQGYDYQVTARMEQCWFPTKEYDGFALPAGKYLALRIVIGAGAGQNWWCVVFPPLCTAAAEEVPETALAAGLTEDQVSLITEEDGGYVLKFKVVEWWESLRERING